MPDCSGTEAFAQGNVWESFQKVQLSISMGFFGKLGWVRLLSELVRSADENSESLAFVKRTLCSVVHNNMYILSHVQYLEYKSH